MKRPEYLFSLVLILSVAGACNQKKKEPEKQGFIPALSIIKGQVAHVDTAFYAIRKIIYLDSTHNDTIHLTREQFRDAAVEFLTLPDIAEKKYRDRFSEEQQFDPTLNRLIIRYTPLAPEKEEIQREELLIRPDVSGENITSIIVDRVFSNRDSIVRKRLLWQIDKSFQVVTIRQLPGQPETTSTYKVTWNEDDQE